MTVGGDGTGEGATHFWVCESCQNPCDPAQDTIPETLPVIIPENMHILKNRVS